MTNFDLIPCPDELEYLFVLESPHKDELAAGIPCAGHSGRNMSENILGEKDVPFGTYLKNEEEGFVWIVFRSLFWIKK